MAACESPCTTAPTPRARFRPCARRSPRSRASGGDRRRSSSRRRRRGSCVTLHGSLWSNHPLHGNEARRVARARVGSRAVTRGAGARARARIGTGSKRKAGLDAGAFAHSARDGELASVQVDDRAGDRHAEAGYRPGLVVKNRSKARESISSVIARPVSSMVTVTVPVAGRVRGGHRQPRPRLRALQRVQDQVQEGLLQLACVETALRGQGWVIRRDDVGRPRSAAGRAPAPGTRRAAGGIAVGTRWSSGGRSARGDLGDDARRGPPSPRSCRSRSFPLGILDLRQVLLEVAHVEPEAGQRFFTSVRRPAVAMRPKRRNGATLEASRSCVLRIAIAACEENSARSSSRPPLARAAPPSRSPSARRPAALDDERRRDESCRLSALGTPDVVIGIPFPRREAGRLQSTSRSGDPALAHRHETALLELEHHASDPRPVASTVAWATESSTPGHDAGHARACPRRQEPLALAAPRRVARVRAIFERSSSRTNGAWLEVVESEGAVDGPVLTAAVWIVPRCRRRHDQHGELLGCGRSGAPSMRSGMPSSGYMRQERRH